MPYNEDIPVARHRLRADQPSLLDNLDSINNYVGANHTFFNEVDATRLGKHFRVAFDNIGAKPVTDGNTIALYTAYSWRSFQDEFNFAPVNDGAAIEFSRSRAVVSGYTRLPSGVMFKWGRRQIGSYQDNPYTHIQLTRIGEPDFENVFSVMVTPLRNIGVNDPIGRVLVNPYFLNEEFVVQNNYPFELSIYYLVIGV